MLGRSQEAAGDVPAAIRTWSEHVRRFPEGAHRTEVLEGLARLDTQRSARWVDTLLAQPGAPGTRTGTRTGPGSGASGEAGARALLGLAERAAAAGETETAVQRYGEFLERFPTHGAASRARYGRAWGLYELGRPAQAAAGLTEVAADRAAEESTRLSALELSIWAWSEAGDPDRAFEAYRSFARVAPDDARLWAAAQVVRKALADADRSADAGRVIEDFLGRVQTPEPALEALIESTWWALDAGGVEAAEAAARGGVKIALRSKLESPRLGEACFFVAERRFEQSELVAAGELYTLATTWGDTEVRPRAFYKLGFCELGRERWREATEAFRALTEAYPRHELYGEALFLAGESEFRAERFAGAEELLARLVREQPKHEVVPKALFRRGVALGRLERWRECAEVLGQLNRRAPGFAHGAEAELWRGRALASLGDRRGARAAFERVIALDEGVLSARARLGLGHGEFDAGEFDAALSQFLRVVVLYASGEEVAEALLFSGRCLEELGNQERAREQYRQVLEEHPESASARGARERLAGLGN